MKKRENEAMFWFQIVAILLSGAFLSVMAILAMQEIQAVRHTVTFAYADGTVIESKQVKDGYGVSPPEYIGNDVFLGWNGRINYVDANIEVHPLVHKIAEENLFYFQAMYVREGKRFAIDLLVDGNVCVSSGTITIHYDPAVLRFIKSENMEWCKITEDVKGELVVQFHSETNFSGQTVIAQLIFKALRRDAYCTELGVVATAVSCIINGQERPADCATLDNKIYFLQEVDE